MFDIDIIFKISFYPFLNGMNEMMCVLIGDMH